MKKELDVTEKVALSVPEAAKYLSVSPTVMYQLVRRTDFPAFKVSPNRVVVSRAGLERWVQQQLDSKNS